MSGKKLREMKPIKCVWELRRNSHIEGRETHILLSHGAERKKPIFLVVMKLREMKPTYCLGIGVCVCVLGGIQGMETQFCLGYGAEGKKMHKCLVVVKLTEGNQ